MKQSFAVSPIQRFFASATLALLLVPLANPATRALAQTTDWATTKGGQMRVIALPPRADGTVPAILQIEPDKGWKTYWREPGSAGIPPQVTLAEGGNVAFSGLRFPVPTVFDDGKTRDYGYNSAVSLPLILKQQSADKPVHLDMQVFIGLCEKICVPFQASFQLDLDAKDPVQSSEAGLIAQAEMNLPDGPSDDFAVAKAELSADGKSVSVKLKLPEGAPAAPVDILITNPDGLSFQENGERSVDGHFLTGQWRLRSAPENYSLSGKPVQILVQTGGLTMETTLAFD